MTNQRPFADFAPAFRQPSALRQAITAAYRREEAASLEPLLLAATLDAAKKLAIRDTAQDLVTTLRANRKGTGVDALVQEYALSSEEGLALMCLRPTAQQAPL